MMSSEEETEFGLYADKLLKKAKRTRQRVDAGEPRNSYSSIPNFSSRPSFLGGGNSLYGAIFTQQQHFGLFGPGFGPAKMLNELLGRQKSSEGDSADEMTKYECGNSRCGASDGSPPPPQSASAADALAHHMLRDILQGRKHHELLAGLEHAAHENGIIVNNNNNDEILVKEESPVMDTAPSQQQPTRSECDQATGGGSGGDMMDHEAALDTDSLPSPKAEPASPARPEDAKKARVENIVSGMSRSSPAPGAGGVQVPQQQQLLAQVNGCKKRKLYQPQQHDSNAVDRYLGGDEDDEDEEDELPEPIRQKRVEKNALKSQLRTMQEQLAEMQQKYVQLCTRMEQESEAGQDTGGEDGNSDTEDKRCTPGSSPSVSREPTIIRESSASQQQQQQQQHQHQQQQQQQQLVAAQQQQLTAQQQVSLAQQVSKLKIGPQHVPPPFNGMLHHDHHHQHHAAAAMYLGVSHKLFLEQEARMAKEAAEHHHQQQQQHHQAQQHNHQLQQQQQREREQQQQQREREQQQAKQAMTADNITERLNIIRNMTPTGSELEGLADALKSEITASLSNIIDSIVTRFVHQRRLKQSEASAAAEQLNKDLMMASQMLDRKSPRTKVAGGGDRQQQQPPPQVNGVGAMMNGGFHPQMLPVHMQKPGSEMHIRPPMFQPPKPPVMPLYGMNQHPFCVQDRGGSAGGGGDGGGRGGSTGGDGSEQNEALSLVVTPKKKRHKVTDTRITPRTVSRILAQDGMGLSPAGSQPMDQNSCPSPRPYHQPPPPPMLPVSLPTSVAIPNPGLHESQVFSPYSPFFHGPTHGHHIPMQASSSPPGLNKMERDSPPLPHPPTLLHPALLAAAQHGASPDYGHIRAPSGPLNLDANDRGSDCNSGDISYDGIQPTISFLYNGLLHAKPN